uniref:Uncharacterized protein n=1 Tax=mine drainage metagenome TaxID=410659 RepID=E6Q840_9ZZZZ
MVRRDVMPYRDSNADRGRLRARGRFDERRCDDAATVRCRPPPNRRAGAFIECAYERKAFERGREILRREVRGTEDTRRRREIPYEVHRPILSLPRCGKSMSDRAVRQRENAHAIGVVELRRFGAFAAQRREIFLHRCDEMRHRPLEIICRRGVRRQRREHKERGDRSYHGNAQAIFKSEVLHGGASLSFGAAAFVRKQAFSFLQAPLSCRVRTIVMPSTHHCHAEYAPLSCRVGTAVMPSRLRSSRIEAQRRRKPPRYAAEPVPSERSESRGQLLGDYEAVSLTSTAIP